MTLVCIALITISCNTHKHATTLQENANESETYYLRGGSQGLLNDLYSAILKAAPAIQDSISGRAFVNFTINKHGLIDHNSIKVIRNKSVSDDYMNVAIEAIKHLGEFEPGKMNGTPESVTFILPIIYPIPNVFIKTE